MEMMAGGSRAGNEDKIASDTEELRRKEKMLKTFEEKLDEIVKEIIYFYDEDLGSGKREWDFGDNSRLKEYKIALKSLILSDVVGEDDYWIGYSTQRIEVCISGINRLKAKQRRIVNET